MRKRRFNLRGLCQILRSRAEVYDLLGDTPRSQTDLERALALADGAGDRLERAHCQEELAVLLSGSLEDPRAISLYEEALLAFRALGERAAACDSLISLASVHYTHGDLEPALRCIEEALALALALGDRQRQASALNTLSRIQLRSGDLAGSSSAAEKALALFSEVGDTYGLSLSLNSLGRQDLDQGRWKEAQGRFEEALQLRHGIGWRQGEASVLYSLGLLALRQGSFPLARERFESSLTIFHSMGYDRGEADALHGLGLVLHAQGETDQATGQLESEIEIRRRLKDPAGEVQALIALGEVLAEGSQTVPAEQALLALRKRLRDADRSDWTAQADLLGACLLACEGKADEAGTAFAKALERMQAMDLRLEEARSHLRFGKILGREKGKPYLEKAQALFSELGAQGWVDLCAKELSL